MTTDSKFKNWHNPAHTGRAKFRPLSAFWVPQVYKYCNTMLELNFTRDDDGCRLVIILDEQQADNLIKQINEKYISEAVKGKTLYDRKRRDAEELYNVANELRLAYFSVDYDQAKIEAVAHKALALIQRIDNPELNLPVPQ